MDRVHAVTLTAGGLRLSHPTPWIIHHRARQPPCPLWPSAWFLKRDNYSDLHSGEPTSALVGPRKFAARLLIFKYHVACRALLQFICQTLLPRWNHDISNVEIGLIWGSVSLVRSQKCFWIFLYGETKVCQLPSSFLPSIYSALQLDNVKMHCKMLLSSQHNNKNQRWVF